MTKEVELPDDYPIHYGYLYVLNGDVIRSVLQCTVKEFKERLSTTIEIRSLTNCDIVTRKLTHLMV